jgi:predicted NBD/HSP70 family sugar kinase
VIHPTTGVLTQAGTMPELDGSHPAAELTRRTGIAVTVFNDVDLAAIGEQSDGLGHDVEDFAVLWVGTGLGAALMLHGQLHRGHRGGAGEVFDVPFGTASAARGGPDTIEPPIDASTVGTIALAEALAAQHPTTTLTPPFDAMSVLDAAALGDPLGIAVRDRLARWIAWYAAAVTAVVDPELIILAGSVGSHDSVRGPVATELASLLVEPPAVVSSKLSDLAVLAGATADARNCATDRAFARRDLDRAE